VIKVDRSLVAIPSSISAKNGAGDKEHVRAKRHYGKKNAKEFKFLAYKEADVVEALRDLFKGKCAYCESKILHVAPPDIEHYRPKGAVAEDEKHPGYWWLASDWLNLLLSCLDCNRSRYHIILEDIGGQIKQTKMLAGKHCSFPVVGKVRAACDTDNHKLEDPLLIDPTVKDPIKHITWSLEYDSALASPHKEGKVVDKYGYASIKGYALNRQDLVQARINHANDLKDEIVSIKLMVADLVSKDKEEIDGSVTILRSLLRNLYKKSKEDRVFSSFSQYVIDVELREISAELKVLLSEL
jgi:uncharacterized protein (TIGR02646 family)